MASRALKDRFFRKVEIPENENDCWEWKGWKFGNGYGGIRKHPRRALAHRVSYELFFGEIPEGMSVCHTCDNRGCVNPKHLWLGTHQDNMDDMMRKGRMLRGEKKGNSKLTEEIVREMRRLHDKEGYRNAEIERMFGIPQSTVSEIIVRTRWSWLED